MSKPIDKPTLAENNVNNSPGGNPNKVEPSTTLKTDGLVYEEFVAAENLNFLFATNKEWLDYFETTTDDMLQRKWTGCSEISNWTVAGNNEVTIAALNDTDIAYHNTFTDELVTLRLTRLNGTASAQWVQVGNALTAVTNIPPARPNAMVALGSDSIAFAQYNGESLSKYTFDGTDWSLTGSSFSLGVVGALHIAALSDTDILLTDATAGLFQAYRFNGATWATLGNDPGWTIGSGDICALSSTEVAAMDTADEKLAKYTFDGTDWTLTGTELVIPDVFEAGIAAVNGSDVAIASASNGLIQMYRYEGTTWTPQGFPTEYHAAAAGITACTFLNGIDLVVSWEGNGVDSGIGVYRWGSTSKGVFPPGP